MSLRALLSSRPAGAAPWARLAAALSLALAACTGDTQFSADPGGGLFTRGLDGIAELYIEPMTSRRIALSGAAQLSRLDNRFAVTDSSKSGFGDLLSLRYDDRDIASFAEPTANDSRGWGHLLAASVAAARRASPRLAALPQETIETAVFDGMTGPLDSFSHYSPPAAARDQRAARNGFGGVGIMLDRVDPGFRVTEVTPHSAADQAGIRPPDEIVAIDGIATVGSRPDEVIRRLRGPVGSAVAVTIRRPGTAEPSDFRLLRGFVIAPSATMSRDGDIAVFRIVGFNHRTAQQIAAELMAAERQAGGRLAGAVLDLRGNPGGVLDQAVSLADLFIHDGPIVSTIGRHPASRQYFAATGDGIAPLLPLVVLIDGASASAAEIVAAALQDAGRAVIIGSSSYGKGTVQSVLPLPNDGELVLTWARLVSPSGYLLQAHGVVPTVCTADLADDPGGLETGRQRLAVTSSAGARAGRPRAALDERGWAELRQACPPRRTRPAIDLLLAEALLADPKLYASALRVLPPAPRRAPGGAATAPAPALTDAKPALSSTPY